VDDMALIPSYVKNKFTADEIESFSSITAVDMTVNEITVTDLHVTNLDVDVIDATTVNATTINADNITINETLTVVDINASGAITGDSVAADSFVGGTFDGTVVTVDEITVDDITSETIITDTITADTATTTTTRASSLQLRNIYNADVRKQAFLITLDASTLTSGSWTSSLPSFLANVPSGYMAVMDSAFFYYVAGGTPYVATGSSIRIAVQDVNNAVVTTLGEAFLGAAILNQSTNRMVSLETPTIYSGVINPTGKVNPLSVNIYNDGTTITTGNGTLTVGISLTFFPLSTT